jgi:hypothetical protein
LEETHNHTDWDSFSDVSPDDFHEGKTMFYTLAQAVCSCITYNKQWKDEMVSEVLDYMFQIPKPWLKENVAGFLLFCNETVTAKILYLNFQFCSITVQ